MPGPRLLPAVVTTTCSSSSSSSSSSSQPHIINVVDYEFLPVLRRFDYITSHAQHVQASLLHSILRQNAGCQYLHQFQISDHPLLCHAPHLNSHLQFSELVAAFRRCVPLVTHADIKPYIDRIVDGGRDSSANILTAAPVDALCLSSGTTGAKRKYLLYHDGLMAGTLEVASIAAAFRERVYPVKKGGRILEFLFSGKLAETKGGLMAGTASTHMIQRKAFKRRQQKHMKLRACSPDAVASFSSGDYREAMYCHLLSGLVQAEEVEVVSAPFAFTLVEALRMLEAEWPRLCADIAAGALLQHSAAVVTDAALRASMEAQLLVSPNPLLASRLEATFRDLAAKSWHGAVASLWPRCKYVLSIFTGAMEPYAHQLRRRYYGIGAGASASPPLVCADYGSTEGWIGVNIDPTSSPSNVLFTLPPSLAFFEFVPLTKRSVDPSHHQPDASAYDEGEAVGMCDVEVGREYEIVMTTAWGLYRYRLGDIVRVMGFYNGAPQVAYVCRKNVMLSLSIDKVTEKDLEVAVERAAEQLQLKGEAELADYSSYADRTTTPGHYVVFWELRERGNSKQGGGEEEESAGEEFEEEDEAASSGGGGNSNKKKNTAAAAAALEECAEALDAALMTEPGYATARKMGSIGELELRVVKRGGFGGLLGLALAKGSAMAQYKTPRCLASEEARQLLNSATVATFFSGGGAAGCRQTSTAAAASSS